MKKIFKRDDESRKWANSHIDGAEGMFGYNRAAVTACQLAADIRSWATRP